MGFIDLSQIGINYRIVKQEAGQLLVVQPGTLYQGFNMGNNVALWRYYADDSDKSRDYRQLQQKNLHTGKACISCDHETHNLIVKHNLKLVRSSGLKKTFTYDQPTLGDVESTNSDLSS